MQKIFSFVGVYTNLNTAKSSRGREQDLQTVRNSEQECFPRLCSSNLMLALLKNDFIVNNAADHYCINVRVNFTCGLTLRIK